ncbi:MAG: hypothetical protein ACFFDT_11375 [Candidatus Hodarchaeota archaeon]
MNIPKNLLEEKEYFEEGYKPIIDYETWRVAILNYIDELLPENINFMSKHGETDEVFVLLKGKCILLLGEGKKGEITKIYAQNMEPLKIYNVKKGVWHNHTLSKDAMVLIVENQDTGEWNSPIIELSKNQQNKIVKLISNLWES